MSPIPRPKLPTYRLLGISLACFFAAGLLAYHSLKTPSQVTTKTTPTQPRSEATTAPLASSAGSPTPTPTLSPAERQAKYGPCVYLPVLMFHHVNTTEAATAGKYTSLNVTPEYLQADLRYLTSHGYTIVSVTALADFFENGTPIAKKSVILTFDDGYQDFVSQAAPILEAAQASATLFVPTGLIDNPPTYATWGQLQSLPTNLFYFGNHTWSHKAAGGDVKTETYEITTANTQLNDHGMNAAKIFAYPYGAPSKVDQDVLTSLSYSLAFTTTPGAWQCKGQRYTLPRIRVGNAPLSSYGL